MQQILNLWQSLDARRRAMLLGTAAAVVAGVLVLYSFAARPSMALLYSGLDGASAGEVLAALDQQGAVYQVRGSAIYVEGSRRDALRMALAADGLPANAGTGYELLDTLSGFGTTSQMFDAAYWRAKEGELARTITLGLGLRAARVHIANPSSQGLRARTKPSASVTVTPRAGALRDDQARGLRYLVASAVPGMSPDDVAVIDGTSGALLAAADAEGNPQADAREEALRMNVERLLEARVGPGNAIVEVSVEAATEREAITERRFDPQSRVAISTDTEEISGSATNGASGAVTVASNLPQGDASGDTSSNQNAETRERVNYEVSETTREVLRTPGAIRRLTVAVLVNGVPGTGADGQAAQTPRSDAELAALRELVASAVGFNEARGDVITLKSLDLVTPEPAGTEVSGPALLDRLDLMTLIQIGAVAIVTLILGLFVLRPLLAARPAPRPGLALPAPGNPVAGSVALTGEIDDRDMVPGPMAVVPATGWQAGREALVVADPVARLRNLVAQRQTESVEVLRNWMDGAREGAA